MSRPIAISDNGWLSSLLPHFLKQTKDRLFEIKGHQLAIDDGIDVFAAMKAICDVAHKISGTADLFGFYDLGEFARDVESDFVKELELFDNPKISWSRVEPSLTLLIQEIERSLNS